MIILGIETSCDETSAALLEIKRGPISRKASAMQSKFNVLSHVVSSSVKEQAKYGGIVPEIAARKQIEYIIPVLQEALSQTITPPNLHLSKGRNKIDAIAVTVGPGLATSLQVGIDTAKSLAYAWQKPIIPVNHLEGHLLSPLLLKERKIPNSKFQIPNKFQTLNSKLPKIKFPAVGLIVSGGHTELILVKDYLKYKLLGRTRDDAAGEAFDKVAKLLDLGYPGGPIIDKLAKEGDPTAFDFPRGMINSNDYDFSFSGLKTAVLYKLKDLNKNTYNLQLKSDICASFQQAVVDVLASKTIKAAKEYNAKSILLGGGVIASPPLREAMQNECDTLSVKCLISSLRYTGDNATMIALAGYYRYKNGDYIKPNPQLKKWQQISVQPNMKLV